MDLKCLLCLAEGKLAARQPVGDGGRVARDAVTLAPSWQQQQVGPQQLWGVVAVPVCAEHLDVKRRSPLQAVPGTIIRP